MAYIPLQRKKCFIYLSYHTRKKIVKPFRGIIFPAGKFLRFFRARVIARRLPAAKSVGEIKSA